jgi:acetoin utilization deacetylase AcuC-like enzyme
MLTVYTDTHRRHDGRGEIFRGKLVPTFEMPRRADTVLARVRETRLGEILAPESFGTDPILKIHSPELVGFLESAWDRWSKEQGDWDAIPGTWPAPCMRRVLPRRVSAQLGYYCFDTSTPITAGTWIAARAAVDVALTAQKRIADGEKAAFALCRPPGHHAARDYYGGYCFLNNAAIAAQAFRDHGAARVAVLDVDYHHGNGTQSIFYQRSDVFYLSLHGDPAEEYPYFLGYAEETGEGPGEGFNANYPMPAGTSWAGYGEALADAIRRMRAYAPDAMVISLGVDTFKADPISKFKLESEDYIKIGAMIASLGRPTLFVMEGGYAVAEIGLNTVNLLSGFEGRG